MRENTPFLPVPARLRRLTDVAEATGIMVDPTLLSARATGSSAGCLSAPAARAMDRDATVGVLAARQVDPDGIARPGRYRLSGHSHRLTEAERRVGSCAAVAPELFQARPGRTLVTLTAAVSDLRALAVLADDSTLAVALDGDPWSLLAEAVPAPLRATRIEVKLAFRADVFPLSREARRAMDSARNAALSPHLRELMPELYAYVDEAKATGAGLAHVHRVAAEATHATLLAAAACLGDLVTPVLFRGGDEMVTEAAQADLEPIRARLASFTAPRVLGVKLPLEVDAGPRLSELGRLALLR